MWEREPIISRIYDGTKYFDRGSTAHAQHFDGFKILCTSFRITDYSMDF
jgi:hypothetical protein